MKVFHPLTLGRSRTKSRSISTVPMLLDYPMHEITSCIFRIVNIPEWFQTEPNLACTYVAGMPSDLDIAYAQQVINEVVKWVQITLLDYHSTLDQNQNLMDGLIGLLVASQTTDESRQELVIRCISSSCSKAFQRMVPPDKSDDPVPALTSLAEQTMELFEVELIKYTKYLAPYCSSAASVAAQQLHDAYGQVGTT